MAFSQEFKTITKGFQVETDTMFHLFENNKMIDYSKSMDSLMYRNYFDEKNTYYVEKFYGKEYQKETMRCGLNAKTILRKKFKFRTI